MKYIRRNFPCGREADSLEDLSGQLRTWLSEVANGSEVHGTTHRVVCTEALERRYHTCRLLAVGHHIHCGRNRPAESPVTPTSALEANSMQLPGKWPAKRCAYAL